jgi:hypothetical protein
VSWGPDYFDRRDAERAARRLLRQLEALGFRAGIETAALIVKVRPTERSSQRNLSDFLTRTWSQFRNPQLSLPAHGACSCFCSQQGFLRTTPAGDVLSHSPERCQHPRLASQRSFPCLEPAGRWDGLDPSHTR